MANIMQILVRKDVAKKIDSGRGKTFKVGSQNPNILYELDNYVYKSFSSDEWICRKIKGEETLYLVLRKSKRGKRKEPKKKKKK